MSGRFFNTGTTGTARAVIMGAPWDGTVPIRPGCRFGPGYIRSVSPMLEDFSPVLGAGYLPDAVSDLGDIVPDSATVDQMLAGVEQATRAVAKRGACPVWLGGEHLITCGAVRGLVDRYPDLLVIVLDAHHDLRDTYCDLKLSHATVCRRIVEDLSPAALVQLGVRSADEQEFRFAVQAGIVSLPLAVDAAVRVRETAGNRPVYISVDIDVVDPSYAPATGSPEPGGPSSAEVLDVLRRLGELNVVGCDVVEVSPPHDETGRTALLAARIVRDLAIQIVSRPDRVAGPTSQPPA